MPALPPERRTLPPMEIPETTLTARKTAARERMTHTILVPTMYNLCLMRADFAAYDLTAWRIAGYVLWPFGRLIQTDVDGPMQ